MKKFFNEFKAFALKGNVMDLAVGVIIGAAFQSIVTSLTNDILNPLLGIAFSTDFSNVVLPLPNNADPLRLGAFISAVLNFVIMAFVLFCIVKAFNKIKAAASDANNAKLTREERKEMIAMGLNFRHIADIKKYRAKKAEEKSKAEAEAAEKEAALAAEKAAAERAANPTAEDLLKEILSVLKEGKDVSGKN